MSSEKLKIKLRNEISNHAQTVDQSRAVTTLAQNLRSKNEAYENEILGLKEGKNLKGQKVKDTTVSHLCYRSMCSAERKSRAEGKTEYTGLSR